jgi:hypothetical protein
VVLSQLSAQHATLPVLAAPGLDAPRTCPLFGPSRRIVALEAAAAAAGAAQPSNGAPGGFVMHRLRALGKGLAVAVPAATISAVSGGALAGSLHAVTGGCSWTVVCLWCS